MPLLQDLGQVSLFSAPSEHEGGLPQPLLGLGEVPEILLEAEETPPFCQENLGGVGGQKGRGQ